MENVKTGNQNVKKGILDRLTGVTSSSEERCPTSSASQSRLRTFEELEMDISSTELGGIGGEPPGVSGIRMTSVFGVLPLSITDGLGLKLRSGPV